MNAGQTPRCASCRHFSNTATQIEAQLPGLRILSSGYGAVRSQDGLCSVHTRYLPSYGSCESHEARFLTAS
jgi:hypothetical protein